MFKYVTYLLTAAAVIILLTSYAGFIRGSTFAYARHEDIGLTTGRIRHTQTLLTIPVKTVVRPSGITTELEISDDVTETQWKRVHTFAYKSNMSPHYIYHSALSQLNSLEIAWKAFRYTPEARKYSARALLHEWETTGNDSTASDLTYLFLSFDDTREITTADLKKAIDHHNATIKSSGTSTRKRRLTSPD